MTCLGPESKHEARTTWLELADLGDVLRVGRGARLVEFSSYEERELSAYEVIISTVLQWIAAGVRLSRTKGDVVRGDAVVFRVARAQILAPVHLVYLGSLAIEERDEDIVTGFDCGRHGGIDEWVWKGM